MTWTAPPLQHLLDARLRDARLDLFSDARLSPTRNEDGAPAFATALIEEKLAAAAAAGLDAIEASLRLAASEALSKKGMDAEECRSALKIAGERLRNISGLRHAPSPWRPTPIQLAGGLFLVWCISAAIIGAGVALAWWGHLLAQGVGLAASFAAFHFYTAQLTRISRHQKNELPAQVCRQYNDHLARSIKEYEQTVQRLMNSAGCETTRA